jgi:hypothetical protein
MTDGSIQRFIAKTDLTGRTVDSGAPVELLEFRRDVGDGSMH